MLCEKLKDFPDYNLFNSIRNIPIDFFSIFITFSDNCKENLSYKFPEQSKKIDLQKILSESELQKWNKVIKMSDLVPNCEFSGNIVKGFGRGSRLLMMPTGIFQNDFIKKQI